MSFLSARSPLALALLATVGLALIGATVAIVPETSQAVVLRFGRIVQVYNPYRPRVSFGQTGAGLKFRVPVFDRVVWIDKRVQSLALTNQQTRSADLQPLQIDAVAYYRIVDPQRLYVTAGSGERLIEAMRPIFSDLLRTELSKHTFGALMSPEHGTTIAALRAELGRAARQYGADVIDVQITRAGLPEGVPLQRALQSMSAARFADAEEIRSAGNKEAMAINAQANADTAQIYQDSFGRDPQFYDFYRAMQSYRTALDAGGGRETNMVLSTDNDYLRQFRGR
jgi:modulator of FtsH protease HflC